MAAPTLLLADENSTTRRVAELGVALHGDGVQIVTVTDGDSAAARIEADRPDLVLAAIGLPKRSGYDLAAFVKKNPLLAHIPVVLLAGALEPLDDRRIAECGCDAVLKKPFDPQELAARIPEWLSRASRRENRAAPATPAPHQPEPSDDETRELQTVEDETAELPTLEALLGANDLSTASDAFSLDAVPASASAPAPAPATAPAPASASASAPVTAAAAGATPGHASLAEAFRSLLAVEQREADTVPVSVYALTASMRTDLLVEEITRRVLDRLRVDLRHEVDAAAARIAAEVAERIARGGVSP